MHIWDVWNTKDYTAYADWSPRFVAEFGFQGPPAWSTLTAVVHDEPLDPDGHEMLVHQKAHEGNRKLADGMRGHLPEPRTIEDWHWAAQLNQAHAIRFGMEWFRSRTPDNTGMVVWQLNDDWPVVSWALVDHAGHRKPVWYAVRAAYRPVLATVQPGSTPTRTGTDTDIGIGTGTDVVVVNASATAVTDEVVVERRALDGTVLATTSATVTVAPADAVRIPLPVEVATPDDRTAEVLVVTGSASGRRVHDLAEVVDQRLDPRPFDARVEPTADGARVTVTATGYVRDLALFPDRLAPRARVDEGLVSLLPGESVVFTVSRAPGIDAGALVGPLVLRHAGDLL